MNKLYLLALPAPAPGANLTLTTGLILLFLWDRGGVGGQALHNEAD